MRKKSRLIIILLIAAIVLCGCGDGFGTVSKTAGGEINGKREETGGASESEDASEGTEKTSYVQERPYMQPEMKGEITISCFYTEEFLETAAEQFMKIYPDVKVVINSYNKSSGESAIEDYQKYLNTKLMTGKAEDILFTGFLPVTKYSEMGVFEDLSGYIQNTPEMNDENYFMNVLEAAKKDNGEIYIIPYMARFDTLAFSAELLSEQESGEIDMQGIHFRTAMDLAKRLVDGTNKSNAFLIQMNAVSYADYLIKDSIGHFIDADNKKINIDTREYVGLLESIKTLSESGYFDSDDLDFYNMEFHFAAECDYDVQAAYYSMDKKNGTNYCMPLMDEEGRTLIKSNPCVAINSAAVNKDLAWEFIRYLLSEEVQTLPAFHGPVVNRRGLEAVAERYYAFYEDGNGGAFGSEAEYKTILKDWMKQINGCDTLDFAIMNLIDEENNKYFSGRQTAGDTAKKLQRQLEQYFNE